MARFIEKRPPTQPTYILEFTQEELDVFGGLVLDLSDPARKIKMDYTVDESSVVPSARGQAVLKGLADAVEAADGGSVDYDYFDFWDEVE